MLYDCFGESIRSITIIRKEKAMTAEELREKYKKGDRVRLISMKDPYTSLKKGSKGTILSVDDAGQIHVAWDNGEHLALIISEDSFVSFR